MNETTGDARRAPTADGPTAAGSSAADPLAVHLFRLTAAAGIALGAWVCWTSLGLTFYTRIGPGPGFFPMWLGLLLALLSTVILVGSFRRLPAALTWRFVPRGRAGLEVASTFVAIAFFALFVERLGFAFTMFAMLLGLLVIRGCRLVPTALAVAFAGSFGVGFAFTRWLGVFVPPAPGGLLRFMGL
jgi:putative tricarboxylic transport membrane protein